MRLLAIFLFISTVTNHISHNQANTKIALSQQVQQPVKLTGRYHMKGPHSAGFDFSDPKTVLWYGDQGIDGLKMRIKWINATTFILRDKELDQVNKDCPPRVYVYQIIKNEGKQLVLKSFWTGWNDIKDSTEEYVKE